MATSVLQLKIRATGPDLSVRFWFDGSLIATQSVSTQLGIFRHEFDDGGGTHAFEIELQGKLPEHTVIDGDGRILHDRVLEISDVMFDEIALGHLFHERAVYTHDYNGNGPETTEKFFGTMGCNGRVKLEFTSPIYLWLLENM